MENGGMKKILLSVVMMTASAVLAVSSSNIFGILRVDSTEKETLISVPWLETDPASGPIKVCDLVLTSNLTAGDRLLFYTGTGAISGSPAQNFQYLGWTLVEEEGVKKWQHVTTVDTDATGKTRITESAHNGTQPVPRGAALIVIRPTAHAEPIYLYGQYVPGTVGVQVAAGSLKEPAYTLLAPSDPNGIDLNKTDVMSGTPDINDYIVIGGVGTMLKYSKSRGKWGVMGDFDFDTGDYSFDPTAVIPHGQGVWYVSRGGAPKFNW